MGKENMRYFGHVGCDECPPSMKDWNEENGDRVAGQASNMAAAYNSYQSAVDDYNKQTGDGDKTLTPPAFGDNWDAIVYNGDGFDAMGAWAWDTVEGAYDDKTGVGEKPTWTYDTLEVLKKDYTACVSDNGADSAKCTALKDTMDAYQALIDSATAMHDIGQEWDSMISSKGLAGQAARGIGEFSHLSDASAADRAAAAEDIIALQDKVGANVGLIAGPGQKFEEQCVLLTQILKFADKNKERPKPLPYYGDNADYNASILSQGDPFAYVNSLTQYPNGQIFFNMETADLSQLQPMVRLFKIITYSNGSEAQVEIPFGTSFSTTDLELFDDPYKRGVGVGLENFTFSYEADNPFAVKKAIKAKLTIFANSFDELLVDRVSDGHSYKYVDLALKTGGTESMNLDGLNPQQAEVQYANMSKLNFRLKAVVGWAYDTELLGTVRDEVKDALYNSYITLQLTPTIHDFDIDEMGRVRFNINYFAYVEDFFDQPHFNIFNNITVEARRIRRKINLQIAMAECDSESYNKIKSDEDIQKEIEEDKASSFYQLLLGLVHANKIQKVNLTYEELAEWRILGGAYDLDLDKIVSSGEEANVEDGVVEALESAAEDPEATQEDKDELASVKEIGPKSGENILFFYVSDLIDYILKSLGDKYKFSGGSNQLIEAVKSEIGEAAKSPGNVSTYIAEENAVLAQLAVQLMKYRVVLGPLELVDPKDVKTSTFVSIGDLPVSVTYFMQWMSKQLLNREEAYYPLATFLNDFVNGLLTSFLNDGSCFSNRVKQKTRFNSTAISSYKDSNSPYDELTALILKQSSGQKRLYPFDSNNPQPLLQNLGGGRDTPMSDGGIDNQINYMFYYAGRTYPTELMLGNLEQDAARGIYHYAIGKDRGIVKNIRLNKTDSPGLKEVRFEQEGYDGLAQLREVFDVSIDCYANVTAFPGSYIFVDPVGFSPKTAFGDNNSPVDLTQIGVGGYHMIIRSEHTFGPGKADTNITAKWVASLGAGSSRTFETAGAEQPSDAKQKCYYQEGNRSIAATEPD